MPASVLMPLASWSRWRRRLLVSFFLRGYDTHPTSPLHAPPRQEDLEDAVAPGLLTRASQTIDQTLLLPPGEEGGLLFSGEETKSGRDERVFGGEAGMALLERLRLQADGRGQKHLVTWPGPKHWRAMLRGEEIPRAAWRPLKSVRRSWRTTIKTGEIDQPHRFHDVRARYVTEVAKVQAAATQDAARHADPATTALYVKLPAGEVRTAVEEAIGRRPGRSKLTVVK